MKELCGVISKFKTTNNMQTRGIEGEKKHIKWNTSNQKNICFLFFLFPSLTSQFSNQEQIKSQKKLQRQRCKANDKTKYQTWRTVTIRDWYRRRLWRRAWRLLVKLEKGRNWVKVIICLWLFSWLFLRIFCWFSLKGSFLWWIWMLAYVDWGQNFGFMNSWGWIWYCIWNLDYEVIKEG